MLFGLTLAALSDVAVETQHPRISSHQILAAFRMVTLPVRGIFFCWSLRFRTLTLSLDFLQFSSAHQHARRLIDLEPNHGSLAVLVKSLSWSRLQKLFCWNLLFVTLTLHGTQFFCGAKSLHILNMQEDWLSPNQITAVWQRRFNVLWRISNFFWRIGNLYWRISKFFWKWVAWGGMCCRRSYL